ncbi:hypothetical protein BGX27_007335 [Mortierella sp. AM989]|nr:hypothetical protein BGX27_007335 [Mortierella sp. AM989]
MPSHSLKTLLKGNAPSSQPLPDNKTTASNKSHNHNNTETHKLVPQPNNAYILQDTQEPPVENQGKASDYKLNSIPGPRKRSILLNMMLPPEAPPVDAGLALPPVILFPPIPEPEGGFMTVVDRELKLNETTISEITSTISESTISESTSTSRSFRSWIRSSGSGNNAESGEEGQITKRNKGKADHDQEKSSHKDEVVKDLDATNSKSTSYTSKSTHMRTWISKIIRTESQEKPISKISNGSAMEVKDSKTSIVPGSSHEIGAFPGAGTQIIKQNEIQQQVDSRSTKISTHPGSDGSVTTVQQQEIVHQEIHQKTRNIALVNVNLSISDIFGLGKVMEVILAMFHAHGAFLRRHPFWLQCVLMSWEGLIVLLLVWGVLRIVGLAEVIVWGADDLVRGTLSTLQIVGKTVYAYFSQ